MTSYSIPEWTKVPIVLSKTKVKEQLSNHEGISLSVAYKSFMYVASFEVLYEVRLDDVYACRGDN